MRVLVTGGAGFIGAQVVSRLLERGDEPVVLDSLLPGAHPTGDWPSHLADVERIRADVRELDPGVLEGVDAVCHQAALVGLGVDAADLPSYASHNDVGTAVVLAAMATAGVSRLVLASSMVVYGEGAYSCTEDGRVRPGARRVEALERGDFEPTCPLCGAALTPGLVDEDAPLDPRNAYATSKLAQEHYAAAWARLTGGTVAALRYHNVYGPWMPKDTPYAGVASVFRTANARGEAAQVFEDGGQRRDFIHVDDVARANLAALDHPLPAGTLRAYNVATGDVRTIGELAGALAAATGSPSPVTTGGFRLGDVRHVTASARRAAAELGFAAEVTFGEGVARFASEPLRGDSQVAQPWFLSSDWGSAPQPGILDRRSPP